MAKWINRGTNEIRPSGQRKEIIRAMGPIRIYRSFQKRKTCYLFLFLLIKTFPKDLNIN